MALDGYKDYDLYRTKYNGQIQMVKEISESPKSEDRWTIAINYAKSECLDKCLEDIQRLQQSSKNHAGVTFVVQYVDDNQGKLSKPSESGHYTHRFLINEGRRENDTDSPSENFETDVTNLLEFARNHATQSKIGLVNSSHGGAMRGLSGVAGGVEVDQFTNSIATGMAGTKLDFLDLDACIMGESSVLGKLKSVASNIVAAEDCGNILADSPTQNLTRPFEHLLNDPGMDGYTLAEHFILEAKAGANKSEDGESTPTLAHYDLSKYDSFNDSLSDLGSYLTKLAELNSKNKEALKMVVDQTPRMAGTFPTRNNYQTRDLKDFLVGIGQAAESQALADPSGLLHKLISNVNENQAKLVPSYYSQGYRRENAFRNHPIEPTRPVFNRSALGGLSVLLPGESIHELIMPETQTLLADLEAVKPDWRTQKIKIISSLGKDESSPELSTEKIKGLKDAIFQAQSPDELASILTTAKSDLGLTQMLLDRTKNAQELRQYIVNREGIEQTCTGWYQFLNSLSD